MDVKTVCLGMLTFGEASGYDLKKLFESWFGHFFAAGYGSIYPALADLADNGLVTCREVPQDGRPDRKVYSITGAGRARLAEALTEAEPAHKVRSEFLAMLSFAHLMSREQIDRVLDHRLGEFDRLLAFFQGCECDCEGQREWPAGMHFVAGLGRHLAKTARQYIEQNRDWLVAAAAPDGDGAPPRRQPAEGQTLNRATEGRPEHDA